MAARAWRAAGISFAAFGLLLLAFVAIAPSAKAAPEGAWLRQRSAEMLAWIAAETDYDVAGVAPAFELWDGGAMRARFPHLGADEDVLGFAEPGKVALRADFRRGLDDSWLLHELVHVVQFANEAKFACRALREREAYALQERWALEHGGWVVQRRFWRAMSCGLEAR